MPLLIAAALFLFVALLVAGVGYLFYVKSSKALPDLRPVVAEHHQEGQEHAWVVTTSLQWIGEKVPLSPAESSQLRKDLVAAGYRKEPALYVFLGSKVVTAALLGLVVFALRSQFVSNTVLGLVVTAVAVGLGYYLPILALDFMTDRRRDRLRMSLPDALDLLVVCVEAGQGIDQAVRIVARELAISHPELSEEFSLLSLEVRAGTARAQAFSNLAARTGESEIKKLVGVLIQTDRFGTSVGDALRTHADYLRVRRWQEAEERAGKVGVKLIFPIFFLIMPSIMIVAAGPGMLKLFTQLGSLANDMK